MKYCADTWFFLRVVQHNDQARSLLEQLRDGKTYLTFSILVYAEVTKKLLEQGLSQKQIDNFFDKLLTTPSVELTSIDTSIAKEAAHLCRSYNMSLVDGIVAATASLSGVDYLLAGDSDYRPLVKAKYLKVKTW